MSGGFAAIPNAVARDSSLHYAAKALFLTLASYADQNGQAYPSQATLGAAAGMSEPTVKRHLMTLRDYGLVTWQVRATKAGRQRFYTVWRPGDPVPGVGSPDGGVGSPVTRPVGSSQGGEQEPLDQEPNLEAGDAQPALVPAPVQRPKATTRAAPIRADYSPQPAHHALASSLGVDLRHEGPQFVDYWLAKGAPKKDWDAALRQWIRNAAKFARDRASVTPIRRDAVPDSGAPVAEWDPAVLDQLPPPRTSPW